MNLANELHDLSAHMRNVAFLLDVKNDPVSDNFRLHSKELKGAAALIEEWAVKISKTSKDKERSAKCPAKH